MELRVSRSTKWFLFGAVIIVGGVLAYSVFAISFNERAKARTGRPETQVDLQSLQLSLELYYGAHQNIYPMTLSEAIQGLDTQDRIAISKIPLDRFTYSPLKNNSTYQLCAKNPVLEGRSQCVSSMMAAQTSGQ